jgi:hypothetical protein
VVKIFQVPSFPYNLWSNNNFKSPPPHIYEVALGRVSVPPDSKVQMEAEIMGRELGE